jgi:hypothetical protein
MAEMVTGQFYRVMFWGRSDANREIVQTEFLMIGTSPDDVRMRFPYVVDLSEFSRYRLDYVVKEPGRSYILSTKVEVCNPDEPDENIKRPSGTQAIYNTPPQPSSARKFSVIARTTCFASDTKHAEKKLVARIASRTENVTIECDELPVSDGFAKPKDVSVFKRASFVRG